MDVNLPGIGWGQVVVMSAFNNITATTYTRSSSWVPAFKDIASIYCDVQVQFGRGLTTVVGPRMLPWRIILSISWFLCHVEFRHLCHLRISALSGQFWYCPDGFNTVRTVSILSGHYQYCSDSLNSVQTVSILSGWFQYGPDGFKLSRQFLTVFSILFISIPDF